MKEKLKNLIPSKRRIIQLYAALLTNANLKGFGSGKIYQGNVKFACAPGLNCYSCPAASASCPLGALQNALANSDTKLPYYIFGILILYGFLFGRWICGFLCPFGLIQDLLHKIKTPKIRKSPVTRLLSYLKYVILIVFVIILPLIYALQDANIPLPAFCKYICPSGTLLGAGGLLSNENNDYMLEMLGPLFTWKSCLLVGLILLCVFCYRSFCRFVCPLGAIYGLFNKISLVGMNLDQNSCIDCGLCVTKCNMDIRHVNDHECISCGECIGVCPTGAITRKGPKILLAPNEVGKPASTKEIPPKTKLARRILAAVLAAVLVFALVYYNVIHKDPTDTPLPTEPTNGSSHLQQGNQVGDLCYSYPLEVYGGGNFTVEQTRGKITILNFWGTWCTPCVAELINEFPLLTQEYGDSIQIVTIHSYDEYGKDVPAFIQENFSDLPAIYCRDAAGDLFYRLLGGGQAWPGTVILDENGVIAGIIQRSTTFEELKSIVDSILE
jgi:ferredoxin